jgi:hypothetical protein
MAGLVCDGDHRYGFSGGCVEIGREGIEPSTPPRAGPNVEWRALVVVLDVAQPSHFWVSVEVDGVLETADGGVSWQAMLMGRNPDIHGLVRDAERRSCRSAKLVPGARVGRFRPTLHTLRLDVTAHRGRGRSRRS